MKTNQIFYAPRFWQYAKAHGNEKKRAFFWHCAVIAMIYFIFLLLIGDNYRTIGQLSFYYSGLISTGFIFALRYFNDLAKPESCLLALMQPASTLEKWLLAVIVTLIVYPIVYTLLFVLMTIPSSVISAIEHGKYAARYQLFVPLTSVTVSYYSGETFTALEQIPFWLFFFGSISYALATSIFFKRHSMIKAVALAFILFLLILLLSSLSSPDVRDVYEYWFSDEDILFHGRAFIISILLWIISPTLMFLSSFFALKGRDI
ncbi:MAG: hypothetical protein KGV50_03490 [Gammaproteobacteria bacterium]|nr:hypothetical protein [Gammaproteobacteria bacterium]